MDVARLNSSHGSHEDHARVYHWVRQPAEETGRGVAVLVDLQGPRIRLGRFADGPVLWATGETVTITTEPCAGDHDRVSTTYAGLASDAAPGDPVLVDDGRVALRVPAVEGPEVRLEVTEGGRVSDSKGLSLPTGGVGVPALSDEDEADLRFLDEELAELRQQVGERWTERRYEQACDLLEQVALADEFADFLTLPAHEVVD